MTVDTRSGISTPLSASTATLSGSPTPESSSKSPMTSASTLIESIASSASNTSSVFVYDLAEQVGFGTLTKSWAESQDTAPVVSLQTRAGAGLSLVGRLSQGTSKDTARNAILTAYTTPTGLAAMTQSLSYLPTASAHSRLILQVPTVTPVGETFALSPSLALFMPALAILPDNLTVLISAQPQEAVDLAALSYRLTSHVIHLFDHHSSTREVGHDLDRPVSSQEYASLQEALGAAGYKHFDYAGDKNAQTVVVLLNGPLALAAKAIAAHTPGLGVVVVRVLRPWDEAALREVLPESVREIHILDDVPTETAQGSLYLSVFASIYDPTTPIPSFKSHRVVPTRTQEYLLDPSFFIKFLLNLVPEAILPPSLDTPNAKKLLFFSAPGSTLSVLPHLVEKTFLSQRTIAAHLLTDHDVFSKPGGITADRIVLSPKSDGAQTVPVSISIPVTPESQGVADFVAVLDHSLLKSHSVAAHVKRGSPLLVVTSWAPAELVSNLPEEVLALIRERSIRLCTINAKELAERVGGDVSFENVLVQLAFLRLYLGKVASEELVLKIARVTLGETGIELTKAGAQAWAGLMEIEIPAPTNDTAEVTLAPLRNFEFNAIAVETDEGDTVINGARVSSWHDAAKHIIFPSAFTPPLDASTDQYVQNPALRPDAADRTFLVTCTVNRRLTPLEYDRNVFHLEFDTRQTGLKYEIGDALGVYGWNDEQEVLDFCTWYGVDPLRLVTIPVPGSDGARMHTRTVFQALQQQIDLFGKPGKTFYSDLAASATEMTDKYALQFIGSPEGAATFKKMSENDTVTFADVLREFASARPGIETLCELVGDIKPRHYSIASAQSVVGDRVDLLVVTVTWTVNGKPRHGQCTHYLAGLKVGQKVTVSTRPSVMKLPPDNLQPLIMAGLGTGAAPFRAFLQHRAMLVSQGIPVGPTYYYFGSRRQSEEYLYGEEIEAFILDGTISRAGLAFSRDGPRKVYIQHKMKEDGDHLARMLWQEQGVFYLCGPTWPVPDVYDALVESLGMVYGLDAEKAGAFLEGLKEEERYVLEVY